MKGVRSLLASVFLFLLLCSPAAPQGTAPAIGAASPSTPLTWVIFGDSIAANAGGGGGGGTGTAICTPTQLVCSWQVYGSYYEWLNLYLNGRAALNPFNCGENGDTAAQMLARVDCVLSRKPDFVVMEVGGNDAAGNVSCASFAATDRQMVQLFLNAGIGVFEVGGYPRKAANVYTTAQANLHQCYDLERAKYAGTNGNRGRASGVRGFAIDRRSVGTSSVASLLFRPRRFGSASVRQYNQADRHNTRRF